MTRKTEQEIKSAILFLEIARSASYSLFHVLLSGGDLFNKNVVNPLEKAKTSGLMEIGEIIVFLKEISNLKDYTKYHEKLCDPEFEEKVMRPLKNLCGWNQKNDKAALRLSKKIKEKIESKTPQEKRKKLSIVKKIIISGGIIIAAIGSGYMIYRKFFNKKPSE